MGCSPSNYNSSISNTSISYAQESSFSSETINLDHCCRRRIENSVLVWLDASHNQSELNIFQSICNDIQLFTSIKDCLNYISTIKDEKVSIVASGTLGQQLVSHVDSFEQIVSIYIFCSDKKKHEPWTSKYIKIKGVFTELKPLYTKLLDDIKQIERDLIGFDMIGRPNVASGGRNQQEISFMYAQLIKDSLLKLNENSVVDMVHYSILQYKGNMTEMNLIDEFYKSYKNSSKAIYWYTRDSFVYKMLNKGLRMMDIDVMYACRVFIRHLHEELTICARKQLTKQKQPSLLYRGQGFNREDFEQLKRNAGGLLSVKNFLSTSPAESIAVGFAKQSQNDLVKVLMAITIDWSQQSNVAVADIQAMSAFHNEQEYLISMGAVFRIGTIKKRTDDLWLVSLTLTTDNDPQLLELTQSFKATLENLHPIRQLLLILIEMGHPSAKKLAGTFVGISYWNVSENAPLNAPDILPYLESLLKKLEDVRKHGNEYNPSLTEIYRQIHQCYEILEDKQSALLYEIGVLRCMMNDPKIEPHKIVIIMDSIARNLVVQSKYEDALDIHQRSLAKKQTYLPDTHPDLACSYNHIATCLFQLKRFEEALVYAQKAVDIADRFLPAESSHTYDYKKNLKRIQVHCYH